MHAGRRKDAVVELSVPQPRATLEMLPQLPRFGSSQQLRKFRQASRAQIHPLRIGRTQVLLDHRNASNVYRVFYIRRAARILPLYLLMLIAYYTFIAFGISSEPTFRNAFATVDTASIWHYLTQQVT